MKKIKEFLLANGLDLEFVRVTKKSDTAERF